MWGGPLAVIFFDRSLSFEQSWLRINLRPFLLYCFQIRPVIFDKILFSFLIKWYWKNKLVPLAAMFLTNQIKFEQSWERAMYGPFVLKFIEIHPFFLFKSEGERHNKIV